MHKLTTIVTRPFLVVALLVATIITAAYAAAPTASNQVLTYAELISYQSGNFTWKTSAPASSNQLVTSSAYATYVNNNGACPGGTGRIIMWSEMLSCKAGGTWTQYSVALSGTATGNVPCNSLCVQGGGSPQPAVDYQKTVTQGPIPNGTYPITLSFTAGSGNVGGCTYSLLAGSTVVIAATSLSPNQVVNTSYTTGTVAGQYTLDIHSTSTAGSCAITGTMYYYD